MFQYCLSSEPTKPCLVLTFKGITLMLDCGLNMQSVLNFMPMPIVPSARFNSLSNWVPRDNYQDWQIEGVCNPNFVSKETASFNKIPKRLEKLKII